MRPPERPLLESDQRRCPDCQSGRTTRPRNTSSSRTGSSSGESTNAPPAGLRSGSVRTALHRPLLRTLFDTFLAITVPWMVIGEARAIPNEGVGQVTGEFSEWPFPCTTLSACEPFEPRPARRP